MARSTKELEELQLYYVIFPTTSEEGYAPDDLDIGFTNSFSIADNIIKKLTNNTKDFNLTRWECEGLGSITKEQIMERYKLKEEDIVKPVGRWETSDQSVWITAKCMSSHNVSQRITPTNRVCSDVCTGTCQLIRDTTRT